LPLKLDALESALAPVLPSLDPLERKHLVHLVAVLISRYTLYRFKEDLGVSADEAAETVIWAVQTLTRALAAGAPVNGRAQTPASSANTAKGRRTK
jgi:hypothetical protein